MLRWLLITFLALLLLNGLAPWMRKLGLGRVPGDMSFKWLGRDWFIPLGSSVLLSLLAAVLARWL
jgi:hypothetical protein